MSSTTNSFWKSKLAAFLHDPPHDPPHKPLRIAGHEKARQSFCLEAGLDEAELKALFERKHDHLAAAADRMIFPDPKKSGVRTDWQMDADCAFRHPLSGDALKPANLPATTAKAEEMIHSAQQRAGAKDDDTWETRWWKTWRLWPETAARIHPLLAYLVADTRIPNHTLWHHNSLVSALSGCETGCSFLLLQIGPVQDFIKQARTTRDLWAGSYLFSYLISKAMFAVAKAVGPESIVYPQLRGVPLIDWFGHCAEGQYWSDPLRASYKDSKGTRTELLTPNLPNRFLALVPTDWQAPDGKSIARVAEAAVREAWAEIAASVHRAIGSRVGAEFPNWDVFWKQQTERFPVVDFLIHDWQDNAAVLKDAEQGVPPLHDGWENHPLKAAIEWATRKIHPEHFDARCYRHKSWKEGDAWKNQLLSATGQPLKEGEPPVIENPGFVWALHYAATEWKFAAVKNARGFSTWGSADGVEKDHLDGRNEVLGGERHDAFWSAMRSAKWESVPGNLFKGRQEYGALSTIKRLVPFVWLPESLNTRPPHFDSVQEIADAIEADDETGAGPQYYAILCMDGDDMGQWVGGSKTPPWKDVLSGTEHDIKSPLGYFKEIWGDGWESVRTPLTPSFHAALSESLANFSLYCAAQIVEAFNGQLIYAGGDDVLAMLAADKAVDCAQALQCVFRGLDPDQHASPGVQAVLKGLFAFPAPGFVRCLVGTGVGEHCRPNWPLMMPGPKTTASVGIAIGHVRSPMQDVIQAARDAEHAAKAVPGKGAFSLRVLKRSGEAVQFSARFDSDAPGVWGELDACRNGQSGRFIYRFLQKLKPLLLTVREGRQTWEPAWDTETGNLLDIVEAELTHSIAAQAKDTAFGNDPRQTAGRWCAALCTLSPENFLHFWMAKAFMNRLDPQNRETQS